MDKVTLSRPTKRWRASVPAEAGGVAAEAAAEVPAKRRRHSLQQQPPPAAVPPEAPSHRHPPRRRPPRRKPPSTSPLLTEPAAARRRVPPRRRLAAPAPPEPDFLQDDLCLRCRARAMTDEQLVACAPMPVLALLQADDSDRHRRGLQRLNPQARARIVNFLVHCQSKLPHPPSPYTLYVSVSCFDRFCGLTLRRGDNDAKEKIVRQLSAVAAAALHLASKMEDVWPLDPADITLAACNAFTVQDILTWERRICHVLDFQISVPTPFDFVQQFTVLLNAQEYSKACKRCRRRRREEEPAEPPRGERAIEAALGLCIESAVSRSRKSAFSLCVSFLLELMLAHPVSIQVSYEVLAASTVIMVLTVISGSKASEILPCLPRALRSSGDEALAPILTVYREFLIAQEEGEKRLKQKCETIAAIVVPTAEVAAENEDGAKYEQIVKEKNPALRRTRMTAYIINRAEGCGLTVSPPLARKTAELILGGSLASPATPDVQPVAVDPMQPLGYFGADVVSKHEDAAAFFRPRFKAWLSEHLECKTPAPAEAETAGSSRADQKESECGTSARVRLADFTKSNPVASLSTVATKS